MAFGLSRLGAHEPLPAHLRNALLRPRGQETPGGILSCECRRHGYARLESIREAHPMYAAIEARA
jgi:hypothetical protein